MPRLYNDYLAPTLESAVIRAEADALIGQAFNLLTRDHGICPLDAEHYLMSTLSSHAANARLRRAVTMRQAARAASAA